jgi:hypothetical protein
MRRHTIYNVIWIGLVVLLGSCGVSSYSDETVEVSDSLSYQGLTGTYVFKPTKIQAERLQIPMDSAVTLKLENKPFKNSKGTQFGGTYYISKMIFIKSPNDNGFYSNGWSVIYSKDTLNNHNANLISFEQEIKNGNDMSFEIHRNKKDNSLRILGFTSDPKYEVINIVDFKKIK